VPGEFFTQLPQFWALVLVLIGAPHWRTANFLIAESCFNQTINEPVVQTADGFTPSLRTVYPIFMDFRM
jgi:hypothetical protein